MKSEQSLRETLDTIKCTHRSIMGVQYRRSGEGKIHSFSDTQKWKEFVASQSALQEMLKEILQAESR